MKKLISFWAMIGLVILTYSTSFSQRIPSLCVDAGHGGSDGGSITGIFNFDEKDINLLVVQALRDSLESHGFYENISVVYTRLYDDTVSLNRRALISNQSSAKQFISVHHNAYASYVEQRSETFWCSRTTTTTTSDAPFPILGGYGNLPRGQNALDTLARKIYYNLIDSTHGFGYISSGNANRVTDNNFVVLRQTTAASALSEASFVSEHTQPAEAWRFINDSANHIAKEAHCIFRGWDSFVKGQGIAIVEYVYEGLSPVDEPRVFINDHYWNIPYTSNWLVWDHIEMIAVDFSLNLLLPNKEQATPYYYSFHHWEHVDFNTQTTLGTSYSRDQSFSQFTDDDGYHYYVAYFKGGPFDLSLTFPATTTTQILNGPNYDIYWNAPAGANTTCSLRVDFSSNNGSTWSAITGNLKYNNGYTFGNTGKYTWDVPTMNASQCKLRIVAWDKATNVDTLISHTFAIASCFVPTTQFTASPVSALQAPLTVNFTDQSTWQPTSWTWNFGDGGTSTAQNPSHTYTTNGIFTVTHTATNSCGTDDTVRVGLINVNCNIVANFYALGATVGFDSFQVSLGDQSTPPNSGISYFWDFGDGTTSTTPQFVNHYYHTPGKFAVKLIETFSCGTDEEIKTDFVWVKCCHGTRGNANDDAMEACNVQDLNYLVAYSYSGGPPPYCWDEADVNSSGSFNVLDMNYLITYFFASGPAPGACP